MIQRLKFAFVLWWTTKYDGTGHRITPWYALQLAFAKNFWG